MKKIRIITFTISLLSSFSYSQTTLTELRSNILEGDKPSELSVFSDYHFNFRLIAWSVPIIKDYEYSDQVMDQLGYRKITSSYKKGRAYLDCNTNTFIEVRPIDNQLSITLQWTTTENRKNTIFINCR